MEHKTKLSSPGSIDDEIQIYIKKKKEENSALKKLLNALESAKKSSEYTKSKRFWSTDDDRSSWNNW